MSVTRLYDIGKYKDITGLEKDQNQDLKLHYNVMVERSDDEQKKFLGDWNNFSKNFTHPDSAATYVEKLRELGIVQNKPEYYANMYTPRRVTTVGVSPDSVIKNYEFKDNVIKKEIDGVDRTFGIVKIYNDTTDIVTDKNIINKIDKSIGAATEIPLYFLINEETRINMDNILIKNYSNILSGIGFKKPGTTELKHPLAFKKGDIENTDLNQTEYEVYKSMQILNKKFDQEHVNNNPEEFKKDLAVCYFFTKAHKDKRFNNDAVDVDLKELNSELKDVLKDYIQNSTYPPTAKATLLDFVETEVLASQIKDFGPTFGTDKETMKKVGINGYYDRTLYNIFDDNHELNQFYLPIDINGDKIYTTEDDEARQDFYNLMKSYMENEETKYLVPKHYIDKNGQLKDFTTNPNLKYFLPGQYPMLDIEKDEMFGERQDILNILKSDPELVGTLKAIYEKYENTRSNEYYNKNVRQMLRQEADNFAEAQLNKIISFSQKNQYLNEGFAYVDTETKEIVKPKTLEDNISRYAELAYYRNNMDQLNNIIKSRNTVKESSDPTSKFVKYVLQPILFWQTGFMQDELKKTIGEGIAAGADALTGGVSTAGLEMLPKEIRDVFLSAKDVRSFHKSMMATYPHYKKWFKANQSMWHKSLDVGIDGGAALLNVAGFMKFMKGVNSYGNPLIPGLGSSMQLSTRQMIKSGAIFSGYNAVTSTFNPDIPIGFYKDRTQTGYSDYAWNDSAKDYMLKIAPQTLTSFTFGMLFPKLQNLGGNVNTIGMAQMGQQDPMATFKAAATFLSQVGVLTGGTTIEQLAAQSMINYTDQFTDDYQGEPVNLQEAFSMGVEQIFKDGEGNFDPSNLAANATFMFFLHGTGNYKRFDFRKNKKVLDDLYKNKVDFEVAPGGQVKKAPPISVKEYTARENYVNAERHKLMVDWADEIVKNHEVPAWVKKGYKGTPDENQAVYNWFRNYYQKPDVLFSKIQELLVKFEGKKIAIPVEQKGTGKITNLIVDYRKPKKTEKGIIGDENNPAAKDASYEYFTKNLRELRDRYEQVYNAYRQDPTKVDIKQMQDAYDEVMDMYYTNLFIHGDYKSIPDPQSRKATYRVVNIGGKDYLYDPLTGLKDNLPPELKITREFGGLGDKVE